MTAAKLFFKEKVSYIILFPAGKKILGPETERGHRQLSRVQATEGRTPACESRAWPGNTEHRGHRPGLEPGSTAS